ncbi:hypothetical protein [Aeromonas veronii]|uniref:hypothetical protein n=1 Tax=Aeromonas veronii TaxID=654 RepID=UPI003F7429B6
MAKQLTMHYKPLKHQEIDQIGMGVLPSGETYLSLNGVAKFCGVAPSVIIEFSQQWESGDAHTKIRGQKIAQLIREWSKSDELPESLYFQIENVTALTTAIHAVPDVIAMAILDYYAHYAQSISQIAVDNYRIAAQYGLRKYIYERLGYSQEQVVEKSWGLFQQRILMNDVPFGYFTAFQESTPLIASMLKNNVAIDDRTLPDSSIGNIWGRYWRENNLDARYGEREKIQHYFPDSFRQKDPEVWAYPNAALPEFRDWLHNTYIAEKYGAYLQSKSKQGLISRGEIPQLVKAITPPSLADKAVKKLQ